MFPTIIGHRGMPYAAPENTMASFKAAIDSGADGLETDLHMTKDGELVLIHDVTLDRTTSGKGLVAEHSLKELKELSAGYWFNDQYKDEKIPSLRDFLEFTAGKNLLINIEIKNDKKSYPGIEKKLLEILKEYNISNNVLLSSFNYDSLLKIKELDSKIKTGILYLCRLVKPWELAIRLGADALHPFFYSLREKNIWGISKSGLQINPYTVNSPLLMKKMIDMGVTGIITDRCDILSSMKTAG